MEVMVISVMIVLLVGVVMAAKHKFVRTLVLLF